MSPASKLVGLFHKSQNVKQAVGVLFVTVLISNILGLVRNIVIANRVGVTYGSIAPLDNYYAAFVLPDLLYSILIVGALSSAILPLLVKIDTDGDQRQFWQTFNVLVSTGLTVVIFGLIILYFILPAIMPTFFPGFSQEDLSLTTRLAQVMLLSPLFFTVSQLGSSALQAKRLFFAPAVAPIIYNLAIIVGALLIPDFGLSGLVVGVIVGAVGHFLIQLPSLIRLGWRFNFQPNFYDHQIRHVLKLMIPRTIALTSTQLLLIAFYQIGSQLKSGSIAIYKLTDDLQTAPVLLLANTLAMAVLPDFARHFSKNEHGEFADLIGKSIRLLLFIFLPATAFLILFRYEILHLYISIGHAISVEEVLMAAQTFKYFVISIFFQGAVLLLARAYFARSDTWRPTLFSLFSIGVAWIFALIVTRTTDLGVPGLSLAFSIGSILNASLLWAKLGLPLSTLINDSNGKPNLSLLAIGGVLATASFWIVRQLFVDVAGASSLSPSTENLLAIIVGLGVGTLVYTSWAKVCNLEQWQLIRSRNAAPANDK